MPDNHNFPEDQTSDRPPNVRPVKQLLTVPEVCQILGVGRDTVYALIRMGELKSVKIHTLRRIRRADLNDYIGGLDDDLEGWGA